MILCKKEGQNQLKIEFCMVNNDLHRKMVAQTEEQVKPYRVLSLDGGGMRGLYTASVLKSLSERFCQSNQKDIGKGFDLIVGTSTGGILACGLATGIPIDKIVELYFKKGNTIFTDPFPSKRVLKKLWWMLKHSRQAVNSNKRLIYELQNIFHNKTLGQIYNDRKIGLCITAVSLIDHSPRVFKTPHNLSKNMDNNKKLTDVCLASSAAPILFPIAHILNPEQNNIYEDFVDGGFWANDPILVSITEAVTCAKKEQSIEIISVGTCSPSVGQVLSEKDTNRGLMGWKAGIGPMELSMDVQSQSNRFISEFLCKSFKESGRNITIHRLPHTAPSKDQIPFFSMDKADQQACSTLIKWGQKDGEKIYGKITRENNKNKNVLKSIFTNLPTLKGGN